MDGNNIEYWSAELHVVFAAIGQSIRDKPLSPEVVISIPNNRGSIVADHEVTINCVSGNRSPPGTDLYIVTIVGPRLNACWKFQSFELENLSRSVDRAIGRPSPQEDEGGGLGVVRDRAWNAGTDLNDRINGAADTVGPPPHMAGTHHDDQAERYRGQAPEDFPRNTGLGGHVKPDMPPDDELSADPEMNIVATDAKGG